MNSYYEGERSKHMLGNFMAKQKMRHHGFVRISERKKMIGIQEIIFYRLKCIWQLKNVEDKVSNSIHELYFKNNGNLRPCFYYKYNSKYISQADIKILVRKT